MAVLKHLQHDRQWRLESEDYLGEISALCFLHLPSPLSHLSSLPFLLSGSGSQLLLYNVEKGRLVQSFRVFDGIRVHGINCNLIKGGGSECGRSSFVYDLVVYGERRMKLFILCVCDGDGNELCFELRLIQSLPKFSNWVLDVCFLKWGNGVPSDEGSWCLAIGCGDNSIYLWDIDNSSVILEVQSPERCLLYSMRLWGESLEDLQIASGTIYNEIIVWKVVQLDSSSVYPNGESNANKGKFNYFQHKHLQYEAFHMCRLVGHEGSIFRIAWSPCGSRLLSASDDRSARIWDIHSKMKVSDDAGNVVLLFGHNARVWDCIISDQFVITAGEDCSCRVWGLDGKQLKVIKEHIGRGIWRCLYDQNTSVLVTGGFDSAIKVHHLHASLAQSLMKASGTKEKEGVQLLSIRIPSLPEGSGLMDSKSEYVRCLRFSGKDTLYIATNHGYLYHAKLCHNGAVEWTQLVRVHDGVQIICMDLLSQNPSEISLVNEDWISIGDGKGNTTIISVINKMCSPVVDTTFSWSAEMDRQLLGVFWCKSLGQRFIFTANPRGALKLWKLKHTSQCSSFDEKCLSVSLIAEFTSSFGFRVMCINATFEREVLICGDLRGNLVLFPLPKDILLNETFPSGAKISPISHFKGAHGISAISSISLAWPSADHIDIRSTGADGCICYLEYVRHLRTMKFVGMKQVKELSLIQSVFSDNNSINDSASSNYAAGFASGDFIIWNLETETKAVQVSCGGWRRPHSFYLGNVPEMKNCFAYVKDEVVHVRRDWTTDTEDKMIPQNLHMQFHGRELHSLCFVYENSNGASNRRTSWIATGCEDGTVRLTRYAASTHVKAWISSSLLGEHVGGSAVRSICCVSRIHRVATDSNLDVDGADSKKDGHYLQIGLTEDKDNPSLLISVGAKRVLTSWLLKKKSTSKKDEDEISDGSFRSSAASDLISFRWLSTDMPVKYSLPPKKLEKIKRMVASSKHSSNHSSNGVQLPESAELLPKSCHEDRSEDDWRYLAVTAFLVRYAGSMLTICFVIVACSDATLALRALVLPHCLWFDVALLAPLSSPVLSLQHIVIPFNPLSDGDTEMGNLYIAISGATDGSISFWDLTGSVEAFLRQLSSIHLENLVGGQTRPRTGRGSQGGRWWRSLGRDISKKRLGVDSVSTKCGEENGNTLEPISDFPASLADYTHDITNEPTKDASPEIDEKADDSSFEICEIHPLHVLSNIHQSGVNCLHVSEVKQSQTSSSAFLYQIVSGGDDQAIVCCRFEVLLPSLSTLKKVLAPEIRTSTTKPEVTGLLDDCKYHNCSPMIKFVKHDKIASAHTSAVKGVWTDGTWVFSTGLDQRVRCWNLEKHSTLTEHAHLIINVPEPEALDVRALSWNHYQIAVVGRGMQMVEFCSI